MSEVVFVNCLGWCGKKLARTRDTIGDRFCKKCREKRNRAIAECSKLALSECRTSLNPRDFEDVDFVTEEG